MMDIQVLLSDLDEQIRCYQNLISFQKNEILKTKTLIAKFQECLSNQNEALKLFIDESEKLVAEQVKRTESSTLIKSTVNGLSMAHEREGKDTNNIEYSVDSKKRSANDETCTTQKKIRCLSSTNDNISIDYLQIAEINDRIVHKIFVHGTDIYIGGSNGLLLRHTPSYTHVYETNTDDDILQIEITNDNSKSSINVFTKMKLITYEDVAWYTKRKEIEIPEIGDVFFDDEHLYIPFQKGLIKRISAAVLKKAPFIKRHVLCFVPCSGFSKLALIVFEDNLLYTTLKSEPREFKEVRGVFNVIGIKRMGFYFLCHSAQTVWLLNSAFQIIYHLDFHENICFIDVSKSMVVVIDGSNVLHLHSFVRDRCLEPKLIYQEKINGVVTALSLVDSNVYLAIGTDIVLLKYIY